MDITWTTAGVQTGLWVAAGVLALVILYHVLFIVSDLRRIVRRAERLTSEVESLVEKPLAFTDRVLRWAIHAVEEKKSEHHHSKTHHHKKKS